MAARDTELACSSAIGGQPIGADGLGTDTGVLQQLSEQTHRSFGIATFLDEHVEDFAFVVDSPPEPHPFARDLHNHLVQVPAAGGTRPGSAKVLSEQPTKLERPTADG